MLEVADMANGYRFARSSDKDWRRYVDGLNADAPKKKAGRKVATKEQIADLRNLSRKRRAG